MDCHFSDPSLGWPKVSLFKSCYMAHPIDIPTFDLKQAMLNTQCSCDAREGSTSIALVIVFTSCA